MKPAEMFRHLVKEAHDCRVCPDVVSGSAILSDLPSVPATVFFVAEAPGYLGAVRYKIPLWGDRTGRNFRAYCASAGVDLNRAYITNAVLCHPASCFGRNRTPRRSEIRSCGHFLGRQIEIVDPTLVVALGRCALESLYSIEPHELEFGHDVARPVPWGTRHLVSLYHPSGRTLARRTQKSQLHDYSVIAKWQKSAIVEMP